MTSKTTALQDKRNAKFDQVSKLKAELVQLDTALALAKRVQVLEPNDVVQFDWGRGEQRSTVTGTVLGTVGFGTGLRIKVFIGSGANADIKTIQPREITEVHTNQVGVQDHE